MPLTRNQWGETCPLAIVGMACRLPRAASEEEFWTMLMEGKVNYSELPEDRLNQRLYFDAEKGVLGKTYSKIGAANDFRLLEADLQKVDDEFQLEDWGVLLSLSVALEACRNAGYSEENFPHKNTGVFMGCTRGSSLGRDWTFAQNVDRLVDHLNEIGIFAKLPPQKRSYYIEKISASIQKEYAKVATLDPRKLAPVLAARSIAATLKLEGQAMIMDAACSSSLSALSIAARSLALGKIEAAIVGGASYFSFDSLVLFSKAQSVSGNLSCPFDHRADGLVCGEGQVFLVVKTLHKALKDGDPIRAVIRGIGVSSDGKGKSLWAPRKEGQVEAIRRAYCDGADPRRLRFVEGHMTSTPLGDLTEISAINEVYRELYGDTVVGTRQPILIGGVKANVGHTLEAAGLVGLAKAVLVLKHKIVPGQINIEKLNEHIDWSNTVLKVPMEAMPLHPADDGSPIQVSVNSFGIGGLNVHVVLEELGAVLPTEKPHVLEKPIAVIGMGCLFPGANSANAYWNLIRSGSDPKTKCPDTAWDKKFFAQMNADSKNDSLGGYITNWEYDWKKHKIPPIQIARANPLQFMILDAVDQAFVDAGYKNKEFDRGHTSVVVGTVFDSDFTVALRMGVRLPEIVDAVKKTLKNDGINDDDIEKIVADYQKTFFERYPALLDDTGSFTASTLASRLTKSFNLMGGGVTVDSGNVSSMAALNTAVDMIRSGESNMVVCVGAQRSTSIDQRLFAENKCLATNNLDADGYYPGEGVGVVILKSLEQAKADGDRIHAVIHDISCAAGRDQVDVSKQSLQTSLQQSTLAGDDIDLLETAFYTPQTKDRHRAAMAWKQAQGNVSAQIGHLGSASGMASLIKAILAMQHQESPKKFSVVLNADTVDCCDNYGVSYSVLLGRETPVEQVKRAGDCAAGIRTVSLPRLRAFMFPGQGSQYKGMLRPLAEASEYCREILDCLDAKLSRLGYPTLSEMAWDEPSELGKNVFHTQLSLLVADTVVCELLRKFGGGSDLILGHSYGEYPALVAAGAWDFESAALITHARCDAVSTLSAGTSMLSTDAPIDRLQEIFSTISSGRLYISNRNAPDQIVVAGDNSALSELDLILKREKRFSVILPVPAGFHSPLVEAVREPLRHALERIPLRFPAHPFLSSISGRFEAEPETIRENFIEQMVRPVDFVALLQKAYQYGVRQFVEVGPRMVLSNLAKKIFAKQDVEIIHCDLSKSTGQEMLGHLRKTALLRKSGGDTPPEVVPSKSHATKSEDVSSTYLRTSELLENLAFVEHGGTPYQIGYENGKRFQREIREILHRYADVAGTGRFQLPDVSSALEHFERFFDDDTLQELKGLAEGAGVPIQPLLRHNLSAYQPTSSSTDGLTVRSGQACVYFAGKLDSGEFVHGANVDVPLYRILPGAHHDVLQLRRPENKIPHLLASGVGCLGGVFGINAFGLCVTTASLSEFPWNYSHSSGILPLPLLGRILAKARTIEETVELIKSTPRTGAWSFGISELHTGRIVHIEYVNDAISIQEGVPYVIAANHQLSAEFRVDGKVPPHPVHSISRYERLKTLLNPHDGSLGCSADAAFNTLRDKTDPVLGRIPRYRTLNTLWRVDNVISVLIDATKGILRLATTDIMRTDGPDEPKRHLALPLAQLLPELEDVFAADNKVSTRPPVGNLPLNDLPFDNTISRQEYIQRNTSKEGKNPNPSTTLFERHVLRLIETPLPNITATEFHGAAIIVSNNDNRVAASLSNRLSQSGVRVFTVSPEHDPNEIRSVLEDIWKMAPVSSLIFLAPHDLSAKMEIEGDYWDNRYLASATHLVILREWISLAVAHFGNLKSCMVLGATTTGGDFGIANVPFSIESGAVSGLLKGLRMEFSRTSTPIRVKVIDHNWEDLPDRIADDLLREMCHWDNDWEAAYSQGRRFILRSIPLSLPDSDKKYAAEKSVWLITGGARGITAAVAQALGKRFGGKLHLVGSSPLPAIDEKWVAFSAEELKKLRKQVFQDAVAQKEVPIKAWEKIEKAIEIVRNLQTLRDENIDFTYHSCDMTDAGAVRHLVRTIMDKDRHITGVIHGAGFEAACRLEKKRIENVRRTLDVKVKGAITLLQELETMSVAPDYVIGFSSVSGRFGGVGQTDYCMANDMLAKLVDWYSIHNPHCRSLCFHWPAWGEIGMAVRPESKIALEAAGLNFMPPNEGINHLLDEIEFGSNEREIVIADWKYYKRLYPDNFSVPPAVKQNVASKKGFKDIIVHGNNADARALSGELTEHGASSDRATFITTAPRDPLGSFIPGINHWKMRTAGSLRDTLDSCKKWLSMPNAQGDAPELIVLTATDTEDSTFYPEGVVVADVLRTWFEDIKQETPGSTQHSIRILDFAADATPKTVAVETLRTLETPAAPGTFAISRWEGQWKNIDIDALENVGTLDIKEISKIHEDSRGDWIVVVPHADSDLEIEYVYDALKTLINETSRLSVKTHICADSTFDLSELKDVDCMVYRRTGDSEADWAELLQQIRRNSAAISGVILMACETNAFSAKSPEKLYGRIEEATNTAVTITTLSRNDDVQFTAVVPIFIDNQSLHFPATRSATALLKTMSLRSGAKVFVIHDKKRVASSPPEKQERSQKTTHRTVFPLIDSVEKNKDNLFSARGQFHPVSDTFLIEHRLNGRPILPFVATLECFLETIEKAKETLLLKEHNQAMSVENFEIHQGFTFRSKKSFDYYIIGRNETAANGTVHLKLYGDYYNVQGQHTKTDKHYSSAVIRFDGKGNGAELNFASFEEHWRNTRYADNLQIYHGPNLRCLVQMNSPSENQAVAKVSIPDPMDLFSDRAISSGKNSAPILHAAVLDAALYACGILHWYTLRQDVCIPSKMQKLVFGPGRLQKGDTAQVHIEKIRVDEIERKFGANDKYAVFNFTVRDSSGAVVYDVQEYSATILEIPQEKTDKSNADILTITAK